MSKLKIFAMVLLFGLQSLLLLIAGFLDFCFYQGNSPQHLQGGGGGVINFTGEQVRPYLLMLILVLCASAAIDYWILWLHKKSGWGKLAIIVGAVTIILICDLGFHWYMGSFSFANIIAI